MIRTFARSAKRLHVTRRGACFCISPLLVQSKMDNGTAPISARNRWRE